MEELFRTLGMNDNERDVYLSVIKAGKISANQVAKETGINRTTVYSIAKKLEKMGVLAFDLGQKVGYLVAIPPENLVTIFEKEEKKLAEKKQVAIELAKELSSLTHDKRYSVPRIRFVEEDDLEEYLYAVYPRWEESSSNSDNVWWGFEDDSFTTCYEKWIKWGWHRPNEGLRVELFFNEAQIEKQLTKEYSGRKMKTLPNHISFDSTLWIVGEYLIMVQTRSRPHYLVEIHDPVLARNQRELFKGLWALAPELSCT
ncbi:conserved hypothetical protein [uncultured spirochete]|uniref:Transcription regulator TrmB N-terminal domain-containing protein n=1 Tax=uncultured spirochete TaxID=156406 RepID=A0A3P3XPY2_9SPIR|nr:conserved hypothetical protein [uncultured spirochete]